MLTKLHYLRQCALRQRNFKVLMVLRQSLATFYHRYIDVREERVRQIRRMFTALMCCRKIRRAIKRIGPDHNTRIVRDVK